MIGRRRLDTHFLALTELGASVSITTKCPAPQCGQALHAIRATRCRNCATESITAGSGVGASSAARASAKHLALCAGAKSP